jgi:hypothetical protein
MCAHYGWAPDFWRPMLRCEFYAWVDQMAREQLQQTSPDSWEGTQQDPWWQAVREKRRREFGR